MSDRDTITLPREVVEEALDALEFAERHNGGDDCYADSITALRTHLAAEQPKPEPVASDDDEEFTREDVTTLLLEVMDWVYAKAHRNRPMTEAEQKVLNDIRTHLAAEQPKPEPVAWGVRWKNTDGVVNATTDPQLAHEWRRHQVMEVLPLYTAPPATHPGYVIGSHWLETAYSRICAGEAEADVLRDCGWERVDEALRREDV